MKLTKEWKQLTKVVSELHDPHEAIRVTEAMIAYLQAELKGINEKHNTK